VWISDQTVKKNSPKHLEKIRNFDVLDESFWQSRFNHVIQVTTGREALGSTHRTNERVE
jgi:hypothetical protein